MPVAIDTSVLIRIEHSRVALEDFLTDEDDLVYIPSLAAAEFLVGTHPPVRADLAERARRIYNDQFRDMVGAFDESDASQLAALSYQLSRTGQQMGFFDACIAAMVLNRGDTLVTADGDYDRIQGLNLRRI